MRHAEKFLFSKHQQNSNNSGICTWYVYQVNKYAEQKAKLFVMLRNPENVIIQLGMMCITTFMHSSSYVFKVIGCSETISRYLFHYKTEIYTMGISGKSPKISQKNGYFNLRVHEMNAADWEIEKIYIFEKLMWFNGEKFYNFIKVCLFSRCGCLWNVFT